MTRTAVVLVLALGLSACGGKDKPADEATPVPTATATASAAPAATTAPENVEACKQLVSLRSQVQSALTGTNGIDPQLPQSLGALAAKAPQEIRPDAQKIAVAYGQVVRAMDAADAKAGATPDPDSLKRLAAVISSLNTPELSRATQHISTWVDQHCAG